MTINPLAYSEDTPRRGLERPAPPPAANRIVLVEDNATDSMILRRIIEKSGVGKVESYMDGVDGLSACLREQPIAVVLDLELPRLRGEEICRILRASPTMQGLPIVIVSELPEAKRRAMELLRMGADKYLEKPFVEQELVDALRGLIARRRTAQAEPGKPAAGAAGPSVAVPPAPAGMSPATFGTPETISLGGAIPGVGPAEITEREAAESEGLLDSIRPESLLTPATDLGAARSASMIAAGRAPAPPAARGPVAQGSAASASGPAAAAVPASSSPFLPPDDALSPPPLKEAQDPSSPPPTSFGGYRLFEVLGAGGMGTVYRALQVSLNRIVALKVLLRHLQDRPVLRERFRREAQFMAAVNHPNIVKVFDVGMSEYTLYFAMEYVDGRSLWDFLCERVLTPVQQSAIVRQACDAVTHLHSVGIIHRDIKPSNFLVARDGTLKLSDFGISRFKEPISPGGQQLTATHALLGTPGYVAPEVVTDPEATELADQYSLGRTFLRVFGGPDEPPRGVSIQSAYPDLPRTLLDALSRSCAFDPKQRFPNVTVMRDAIIAAIPKE